MTAPVVLDDTIPMMGGQPIPKGMCSMWETAVHFARHFAGACRGMDDAGWGRHSTHCPPRCQRIAAALPRRLRAGVSTFDMEQPRHAPCISGGGGAPRPPRIPPGMPTKERRTV